MLYLYFYTQLYMIVNIPQHITLNINLWILILIFIVSEFIKFSIVKAVTRRN